MTAARELYTNTHHHPAGMTCVVCVIAGIDVAPSEVQASRLEMAERIKRKRAA